MHPDRHAILLANDEAGAIEFPSDFDEDAAEKRARNLAACLAEQGIPIRFDDWFHNQDASFGLALIIKSAIKETPRGIIEPTIRISNFGAMAAITFIETLPNDQKIKIQETLNEHGYTLFCEKELDVPYDGVNAPNQALPTWWARYFDWL